MEKTQLKNKIERLVALGTIGLLYLGIIIIGIKYNTNSI